MTEQSYSEVRYVYNGNGDIFTIPFDYIEKKYIHIYINKEETFDFSFYNKSQVQINNLGSGDEILIKRETPIDAKIVVFSNTSLLDKECQNLSQDQHLHALQEVYDSFGRYKNTVGEDVDAAIEAKNKLDETIEEWQKTLDLCKSYRDESELYAETCVTGVKWFYFKQSDWGKENDDNYYLSIDGKSIIFDIYKKCENGNKEKIFNCDITVVDNGIKITSPEAFEGYAVMASNTIGEYVFEIHNPQPEWIIEHNLGKYPSVTTVDTTGYMIIGQVQYVDLNTVKINFTTATNGKAFLN